MAENILTTSEFGAKTQSRYEVYRLLITDAELHMLPIKESNYDCIAGVLWEKKKYFAMLIY